MKRHNYIQKISIFMLFLGIFSAYADIKKPKLTVVIVIDQFGYHYIPKLYPHLQYGLKTLLDKGIVYENSYLPHGMPATGTGHTGLNTGAYAKDHGIIGNDWTNPNGEKVECDYDTAERAAVFAPNGFYDYGKSARNIMVNGISDQFVLASQPNNPHLAFGLSFKSRSSICTAGQLGKAIWYDEKTRSFTSSKAYYDKLPEWLREFSQKQQAQLNTISWQLMYPETSEAYNFFNTHEYTHANRPYSCINRPIYLDAKDNVPRKRDDFSTAPQANKLIFDLATACINAHTSENPANNMLVWVCVSSLDKLGHTYGTETIETIDMIYQLDKQIQDFMEQVITKFDKEDVLFALSADHGSGPIVELMHKRGLDGARRIRTQELTNQLNEHINKIYNIENCVLKIKQPHCHFDMKIFNALEKDLQEKIMQTTKEFLLQQPGIKQVWTYDELYRLPLDSHALENYFKQQLFKGRSGQLIIQTYPYVIITKNPTGLDHKTPYEYDTHIPLILYQPGHLEGKKIYKKVWALQLANTLAQILKVQKPSASTFEALPGIFGD
jgi:predicted AlkP superfamily pyrophosphatase or phosphodiesterase